MAQLDRELTAADINAAFGSGAAAAFQADGPSLLVHYLAHHAADDPARQQRLRTVLDLLRSGETAADTDAPVVDDRAASPATSLVEATASARRLYELGRGAAIRARFGRAQRAGDVSCFETFRFAAVATDDRQHPTDAQLFVLGQVASWHGHHQNDAEELWTELWEGTTRVDEQTSGFSHRSMLLKIASSNSDVSALLQSALLEFQAQVAGLKNAALPSESTVNSSPPAPGANGFQEDLELVAQALFIIPRGRTPLRQDAEFDRLRRIYEEAVPWTARRAS